MAVVLAGCGDLGTEVGLRLADQGVTVWGLRRRAEVLPDRIIARSVDLAADRVDLPEGTDAVVIATTPDERSEDGYRRGYLDTLSGVLDGVDRLDEAPRRIIWVSSTGVYDVDDGGWIDETTEATAGTGTAGVLVEAERLFRRRVPGGVIVRLGGIYGPGRDRLVEQVKAGIERLPSPESWVNLIHRDDAAAVIVHLLTRVDEPAPVYLGVDGVPARRGEVADFVAEQLGVPGRAVLRADAPPSGKRCRNDALAASGFTFTYPDYRAGYRAVVAGHGVRHP